MMLGRNHGGSVHGQLWTTFRQLEMCPVGTIVRNGCDHRAPAGAGTHLRKMREGSMTFWVPCKPSGETYETVIAARDINLPVQVVVRGSDEQ